MHYSQTYSAARTAQDACRRATAWTLTRARGARRSACSGERQHGPAHYSLVTARHARRRAHTPAHYSPVTARHARRREHTGKLQHGAAPRYRASVTHRSQHCTHGAVRTQRDWSTVQCASAPEHSTMHAQARALQGTSGCTVTRAPQTHAGGWEAPHTWARGGRTRRKATCLRFYGYLDSRGH